MQSENNIPLTYKNHPLIRKGNTIYYGSMSEKYIILLEVLSSEKLGTIDLSKKVSVKLQLTDPDISSSDKVIKETERNGLYDAIDIASIWLDRALGGK